MLSSVITADRLRPRPTLAASLVAVAIPDKPLPT